MQRHGTAQQGRPRSVCRTVEKLPQIRLFTERPGKYRFEFLPFIRHDGEDGTQLNGDFGVGGDLSRESQSVAGQDQVAGGRDRQKSCQSFDDAENYRKGRAPFIHRTSMVSERRRWCTQVSGIITKCRGSVKRATKA